MSFNGTFQGNRIPIQPISSTGSSLQSIVSDGSCPLVSMTSPMEPLFLHDRQTPTLIDSNRFTASIKILDRITYLRGNESGLTAIKGSLVLSVSKPLRIPLIKIVLKGQLKMKLFPAITKPTLESSYYQEHEVTFFEQSRSWQYKANDAVFDSDYFNKGHFTYPFQFLLPNDSPESMDNIFGSSEYSLNVFIRAENGNTLTRSLYPIKDYKGLYTIQIVQCSMEPTNTTQSDAIGIGNWRNLVYYKVSLSNRQTSIGGNVKIYIKLMPILSGGIKLNKVTVVLDQVSNYSSENRLPKEKEDKYHKFLAHTERISLPEFEINEVITEDVSFELTVPIYKYMPKFEVANRQVKVVPSTNDIENHICHFKVSHNVNVSLIMEDVNIEETQKDVNLSINVEPPNSLALDNDKNLITASLEKSEGHMIKMKAKLVDDPYPSKKINALTLKADVDILKGESVDGNLPPPDYGKVALTIKNDKVLNSEKEKSQLFCEPTTALNFIIPPSYEESSQQLPPPVYKHQSHR
ncbi:hypothetical protein DAMA08_006940 [Martiniozyma asiatica (nom. inval.)]|nr:hypothetical protein DAMA08_006940 [Martiniozyma asiatica]